MRFAASKPIAVIAILILSGSISACAVSKPATLQLSDSAQQTISSVEFPAMEVDDSNLRSQWAAALDRAFRARSVRIEESAPYIADFALSVREARSGLAKVNEPVGGVDWQSEPRDNRLLDICKAKRLRGSLVLFSRATGKIAYRGESEADGCKFGPTDFDAMATQLVSDATK